MDHRILWMVKLVSLLFVFQINAQDYEVQNIECSFGEVSVENNRRINQIMSAQLRKPEEFLGSPIFADDRSINPEKDPICQIRSDPNDKTKLKYQLLIKDLEKCGVLVKNGFINVRVWFPKLPGVVMMSDQEVIIMCKPPERVVTQNKAAGFAGALPSATLNEFLNNSWNASHSLWDTLSIKVDEPPAARVSGVVQESPGTLEYEVALYREASPRSDDGGAISLDLENEIPVDQAVPIGTKLQLRATINEASAWKYVKLQEVTISTNPKDAYSSGHIMLVKDGCRKNEFTSIVPRQPYRPETTPNEVRLEFEAVLLDVNKDRKNQLWIHAKIKACVSPKDCDPEFCLDLYQPSGMGKRRKRNDRSVNHGEVEYFYPIDKSRQNSRALEPRNQTNKPTSTANIDDNVGVTVIMPGDDYYSGTSLQKPKIIKKDDDSTEKFIFNFKDCEQFVIIGAVLGCCLVASSLLMCFLSARLMKLTKRYKREKLEGVVREHRMKFGQQPGLFVNGNRQQHSTASKFMPQR